MTYEAGRERGFLWCDIPLNFPRTDAKKRTDDIRIGNPMTFTSASDTRIKSHQNVMTLRAHRLPSGTTP
jgi:hypothetical protein